MTQSQPASTAAADRPLPDGELAGRAAWFGRAILDQIGQGVCVSDAVVDLPGPTIEYVNDAYLDIFCCSRDDVIGRDPRIGQGPLTDRAALDRIRSHLVAERTVLVKAINYRIDRTPFRLRWTIDPLRDAGELVGFVALLDDVTVEERVRRRLKAIGALTSLGRQAVTAPPPGRRRGVAAALAVALTPLLDEVGEATVVCDGTPVTTASVCASVDRDPDDVIVVTSDLTVLLSIHPDGGPLVDRVAIDELCDHASWLFEISDRR